MTFKPMELSVRETFIKGRPGHVYTRPTIPMPLVPGFPGHVAPNRRNWHGLPINNVVPIPHVDLEAPGPLARCAPCGASGLGMAVNVRDVLQRNAVTIGLAIGALVLGGLALSVVLGKKRAARKRTANRHRRRRRSR